ncbi:MAG: TldD/PmbA family protein [candidate division WOR-3 bacterium]|jgi:TldD protein|nr:TldD/PmbA family protein [candidate division WOR-3 bacterium]MCR4423948.1 TldD/PmbA family protein [candidate division WOR-3 bacterium]MDH7519286.1 TldD/PmbA family protein [bacterium]
MTVSGSLTAIIKEQLQRALDAGCSFADARYYEEDSTQSLILYDGNLEGNYRRFERGIGVRVLKNGAIGFAATADLERIPDCFARALANAEAAAVLLGFPKDMGNEPPVHGTYKPPFEKDPFTVPLPEILNLMKTVDQQLNEKPVEHRMVRFHFQKRHIFYFNSEGSEIERWVMNPFANMTVMARDKENRTQRRSYDLDSDGTGPRGFEWVANPASFAAHADRIKSELSQLLSAETLPPARRDVILLPGQGHLQVHETIGHPLELDRILGYELSFAGGSHVKPQDIGTLRYGSEKLNAVVMIVENSPGTFGYDDEGTPQHQYYLIKNGILVNVLCCRLDLGEANAKAGKKVVERSGASARAAGFYKTPIDRMTNVCVEWGSDGTLEDIVRATENGVILDMPVSWSIGSNREHFHFGCEIAWEVKDGRRTRVYKNPTYQGHTLEFYNSLDMVGDRSTWRLVQVPNCGKGEPNQIMEVGHGVPVMRFRNVLTGEGR